MKWRILQGDVREKLRELPDGSVQTCVTSPPYFGLRDYGHDGQIGLEPTPDEFVAELVSELNPEYVKLAEKRIGGVAPLFAEQSA